MTARTSSRPKWQVYGMYGLILVLSLVMALAGIAKLMGNEMLAEQFRNFGYPVWFFYLTGVLEVLAAILL